MNEQVTFGLKAAQAAWDAGAPLWYEIHGGPSGAVAHRPIDSLGGAACWQTAGQPTAAQVSAIVKAEPERLAAWSDEWPDQRVWWPERGMWSMTLHPDNEPNEGWCLVLREADDQEANVGEQVTFGAAAARALLDAGVDVVDCDGDSCLAERGKPALTGPLCFPCDNSPFAPFRLANPDAELTEEQAEAVCKTQEGLCVRKPQPPSWPISFRGGVWMFYEDGTWRVASSNYPGGKHPGGSGGRWRLAPDPSKGGAPEYETQLYNEDMSLKAADIREIAARAAAESRAVAEQPARKQGEVGSRKAAEAMCEINAVLRGDVAEQPDPETLCTQTQAEAYEARIRELEAELGKSESEWDRANDRAEAWEMDRDRFRTLLTESLRRQRDAHRRCNELRAELQMARDRCDELMNKADTLDSLRFSMASTEVDDDTLPRTTRLLSEAVLHAEAGGVLRCDGAFFRVRGGRWQMRADGEWIGGPWTIHVGVEYTLHPADYLDVAPEKVEPKHGADFRRWLVETGRVGVDEDGDRTRWSVDSLRYVYWIDDAWVAYSGPADNDTGLPESGTWESEQ